MTEKISKKEKQTALILAIIGFIGFGGIHRFYVKRTWTGILWLLTVGLFYIGTIVDVVKISNGNFKDGDGAFLRK